MIILKNKNVKRNVTNIMSEIIILLALIVGTAVALAYYNRNK